MSKNFNYELFRKAIFGLNANLENVGGIFHKNIDFLASNLPIPRKEAGVNKMAIEITGNLKGFKNSLDDFEKLFNEIESTIDQNEENTEEYAEFMCHVEETFPKYISELNQSMNSMNSIEIKTEPFDLAMKELNKLIIQIIGSFKKFLKLSEQYSS